MEYTKGEWFATECSMGQWVICGESGRDIAVIYDHDEHTEANARLIAAAPEMYDALKALERPAKFWDENDPIKQLVFKALRKAEGGR